MPSDGRWDLTRCLKAENPTYGLSADSRSQTDRRDLHVRLLLLDTRPVIPDSVWHRRVGRSAVTQVGIKDEVRYGDGVT